MSTFNCLQYHRTYTYSEGGRTSKSLVHTKRCQCTPMVFRRHLLSFSTCICALHYCQEFLIFTWLFQYSSSLLFIPFTFKLKRFLATDHNDLTFSLIRAGHPIDRWRRCNRMMCTMQHVCMCVFYSLPHSPTLCACMRSLRLLLLFAIHFILCY